MKPIKKLLLLLVTVAMFSVCSIRVNKSENEFGDNNSDYYFLNHSFGDQSGNAEGLAFSDNDIIDETIAERKYGPQRRGSYYSADLSDKQKKAYIQILKGIKEYKAKIYIKSGAILEDEIGDFISYIFCAEPDIHQLVDNYGLYIDNDDYITEIDFNYSCSKEQGDSELYMLNQEIKKIVDNSLGLSDLEKLKYFHDHIILNCKYDDSGKNKYSAYGCLIEGKAVCEGYAKALSLLCNKVGIPCLNVVGESNSDGVIVPHMWNMVMLNNKWYHVDLTWDDPVGDEDSYFLGYDYFTLTDDEIFRDHTIGYNKFITYPKTSGNEENYFVKSGSYVKNDDDIAVVIERTVVRSLKNSSKFVNLKFQSKEKYEEAIKKYFDEESDGIFDIIKKAQDKSKVKLKSEEYYFSTNDITYNINVELDW